MIFLKSLKYIQEAKAENSWCGRRTSREEIKHNRQIFNKIVTKNFPNSEKKELQIKMTREDTLHHTLYSDVRNTQ